MDSHSLIDFFVMVAGGIIGCILGKILVKVIFRDKW